MTAPTDCADVACVLCVGQATFDHVMILPAAVTVGLKHAATDYQVVGGGVTANAAVAVSRLGGASILASCVGDDPTGRLVLEGLADERVDT
ncbi:MAG: carbohydrate kinase, partial [Acidimicrobiales bacterium]